MAAPSWLKALIRVITFGIVKAGKQGGWIDPNASQKPPIKK